VAEQLAHVPVEVTLIDQHDYHTFQPLLYQVATFLLNSEDVGVLSAPGQCNLSHGYGDSS
jgi:NADH dehydrogenase FAD-containing subunit